MRQLDDMANAGQPYMSTNCNLTWAISNLITTFLLTLLSLCLVISFIQKYIISKGNLTSFMLLLLSIFTLVTFTFLLWTMYQDIYCFALPTHAQYHNYHQTVFLALYWTQTYLVSVLFYLRLRNVFKRGVLKLSKCTHYIYLSLFICIAILIPIVFFLWKYKPIKAIESAIVLFVVTCLTIIGLNISLTILFATKLLILHKHDHADIESESESLQFISLVMKTTILVFFSSIATVVNIICVVIRTVALTEPVHWVVRYSFVVDVFTNVLCVTLSYSLLDKYYHIICKPMTNGCRWYCEWISNTSFIKRIETQCNTNDAPGP
eukprot:272609_1